MLLTIFQQTQNIARHFPNPSKYCSPLTNSNRILPTTFQFPPNISHQFLIASNKYLPFSTASNYCRRLQFSPNIVCHISHPFKYYPPYFTSCQILHATFHAPQTIAWHIPHPSKYCSSVLRLSVNLTYNLSNQYDRQRKLVYQLSNPHVQKHVHLQS